MPDGAAAPTVMDWNARFDELVTTRDALTPEGLDELGMAAWFLGRLDTCEEAWDAAHRAYLEEQNADAAIRCAFWLAFVLGEMGFTVRARAWVSRLLTLCAEHASGSEAEAIALLCRTAAADAAGDSAQAIAFAEEALARATSAGASDVVVLSTMRLGMALVHAGRYDEAFARFDDVMLSISAGVVSDRASGPAYCAVVASCLARGDVERAASWTRHLSDWCDAQVGLLPFRGDCTVHRAAILDLGGEWEEAAALLGDVVAHERRPETLESAWYALGDLHRRAGRSDAAEDAFRRAGELGREVQPGLAHLRRDAGRTGAARRGVARALEADVSPAQRADLLAAQVEFACESGDAASARSAADLLRSLTDAFATPYLTAVADRADGAAALAEGSPDAALRLLRRSWGRWRELDAPYDGALTRILLGRTARALGDEEAAQLEFDAAREILAALGAVPDLVRLERLAAASKGSSAGLSRREVEVIRLVAAGCTNRAIAERLFLSERTVARHVGNILSKLGVANRAGATAFAFEHDLVDGR